MPHVIMNFVSLPKLSLALKVKMLLTIKLNIMPTTYPIAFAAYKLIFACMRKNITSAVTPVFKIPTIIYLTSNLFVDTLNLLKP